MNAEDTALKLLTVPVPDRNHAEAVRMRCRLQRERRRERGARAASEPGMAWRLVGPLAISGLCLLYAAGLVASAVSLRDLFQ